jgi:hypothetical protein
MATTWTVTRSGDRVRIDITKAFGFEHADTEAIAAALEKYLSDDGVAVIKFGGSLLEAEPADGLGAAIRRLGDLARSRGKRFDVGPI